ncbi:acetyl-CoA carboxylase biotin carboxyl carrier protein [Erwinia mallotivora]|uniref:Biotin attachment protein n=1 Tax=Erwinia mallotivora TaxID=69222 RepID=A0A014M6S8_9GAMM|nr:acetyl-CoA carboxylase biotin carboxyl carrier protein subunit [Erwinia mallotivora]EXU73769.1 biotin attachment protein [Erwinia mallotivora]
MEKKAPEFRALRDIARKMRQSGLSEIALTGSGFRISMKCAPGCPVVSLPSLPETVPDLPAAEKLCAPFPGIVLLQHPLNNLPFTQPGAKVEKNTLLGLLKVGGIYLPLRSPVRGTVESMTVQNGDGVEYGAEIFTLRQEALAA